MEPTKITFDEIRRGDRIRAEFVNAGVTVTWEGIVDHLNDEHWLTAESGRVCSAAAIGKYYLVDRPKAPLPGEGFFVAETPTGARVIAIAVTDPNPETPPYHVTFDDGSGGYWEESKLTFIRAIPDITEDAS